MQNSTTRQHQSAASAAAPRQRQAGSAQKASMKSSAEKATSTKATTPGGLEVVAEEVAEATCGMSILRAQLEREKQRAAELEKRLSSAKGTLQEKDSKLRAQAEELTNAKHQADSAARRASSAEEACTQARPMFGRELCQIISESCVSVKYVQAGMWRMHLAMRCVCRLVLQNRGHGTLNVGRWRSAVSSRRSWRRRR